MLCLVAQSCPTLCNPTEPASLLCPWEFSRQEYWSRLPCPPPRDLPNPGIEPRSPTFQVDSLLSEPPGKPKNTGVDSYHFSRGSSQPRNWTRVSCIAGGFFTSWATREAWIKAKHLKIVTKLWHRMIPCQHGWALNTSQYFCTRQLTAVFTLYEDYNCYYCCCYYYLLLGRGKSDGGEKDQPHCEPACVTSFRIKVHCKRLLEPRSHLCILFHWGRESVYSNVWCWIQYLSLIFTLYFISLSVITSQLFTYVTSLNITFPFPIVTGLIYQSS